MTENPFEKRLQNCSESSTISVECLFSSNEAKYWRKPHSVQGRSGNTQPMGEDMKEKNEVEKRMQLPEAVYKLLAGEGIQKEDILYKAEPDLDAELRFARNYLVMTKEVLVLISYPYRANGKFRFGGYAGNEPAINLPEEPEIKKLSLEVRASNAAAIVTYEALRQRREGFRR